MTIEQQIKGPMEDWAESQGAEILTFTDPSGPVQVLVVPHNKTALDITPFLRSYEATLPAPLRRRGTFVAETLASLSDWAKTNIKNVALLRDADGNAKAPEPGDPTPDPLVYFAQGLAALNNNWKVPKLSLTVIGNYSKDAAPGWHDFQGTFAYPISEQWRVWGEMNAKPMSQLEFAVFIENRLADLGARGDTEDMPEDVQHFLGAFDNAKEAMPGDIIRLSRGLEMYANFKVAEARNYQTGEGALTFSEEHQAADGKKLVIPPLFYLRIPIFMDNSPALIPVRLRYRMVAGKGVMWHYEMLSPEVRVADMFLASLAALREGGAVTLLGSPDTQDVAAPVDALVVNKQGIAATLAVL